MENMLVHRPYSVTDRTFPKISNLTIQLPKRLQKITHIYKCKSKINIVVETKTRTEKKEGLPVMWRGGEDICEPEFRIAVISMSTGVHTYWKL